MKEKKIICDNCNEDLEEGYVIQDLVGGLSVMKHHNHGKKIVLCEDCYDEFKSDLINNECWRELDDLDNSSKLCWSYKELKKEINKKLSAS